MTENPKAAWPKTPDGTIDWEVVFEDPDTGLIPLIEQVHTPEALKASAEVIIQKLFTRKNDADARTHLMFLLDEIIKSGGEVDTLTAKVVTLLREVKDERIEKARVYVERKRAGASIDRRAGLFWKIDKLLRPAVLLPVGSVLVIALAGLVYFGLHTTLGPDKAAKTPSDRAPTSADEAAGEDGAQAPDTIQAGQPFPIWLKTVRWPVDPGARERPRFYAVIPYVTDLDHKIEFCRLLPKMMDRIYVVMDRDMPKERLPRIDEMKVLEQGFRDAFNAELPDDYVVDVVMARYGSREFKVSTQLPFCKSPKISDEAAEERSGR